MDTDIEKIMLKMCCGRSWQDKWRRWC